MLILKTKMRGIRSLLNLLLICGIRILTSNLFYPSVDQMSLCSPSNHISTYHLVQLKIQASPKNEDQTGTFVLPILWCSQNDDHPERKHLTRFGYTPNMNLKKKDPSCLPIGTYHKNLAIEGEFWNLTNLGHFFVHEKMFWYK